MRARMPDVQAERASRPPIAPRPGVISRVPPTTVD